MAQYIDFSENDHRTVPWSSGLAMPSTWDIQNVITSGGQPCVVLGYSEKQPFFNPNMIGGATAPQLERSIGFYNSGGLISKPMSFNQFKRAVKKINKE